MDDAEFLDAVAARLPSLVGDRLDVIEVRLDRSRSWVCAEARFEVREASACASAFLPFDRDWRYLSGFEREDDYAALLASKIRSAARAVTAPSIRRTPATGPVNVAERWQWLLERLALNGRVVPEDDDSLRVIRDDGRDFTVVVTPKQWARIAAPMDPDSDDPQDFNQLSDEEAFLVFYEDSLRWSIRADLPPVPFGAQIRRSFREARERGEDMSKYGWFARRRQDDQFDRYDDEVE